jgi:transcriptional regulator with XRE-family HTH domain
VNARAKDRDGRPFGDWLSDELSRREWSQRLLARKVGVTSAAVSRWVRGLDTPGGANIAKIAGAFGLDAAVVMHRVNGSPGTVGFLAALEDDLTAEEMESVKSFVEFVRSRRGGNGQGS